MIEIKDCLPEVARKHFVNLFNIRLRTERAAYEERLTQLRGQLSAKGQGRSGWQEMEEWKYREEFSNALAKGHVQDAMETCDLYDIPLTESLCKCMLRATEDLLNAQYHNALKQQAEGISRVRIPLSVRQDGNLRTRQIMTQISVIVEKARVEWQKKAAREKGEAMSKRPVGDSSGAAQSSIVVHGDVTGSTFQQGNQNVAVIDYNKADMQQIIEEVKAQIVKLNLSKEDADELSADIGTVEVQLASSRPKHRIIRESLTSVRHVMEHAMGAALAHAGLPLLMSYLGLGAK
jgi:hypothetical protein